MNGRILIGFTVAGVLSLLVLSCPAGNDVPLPGDPDYIPPDWSDPVLNYAEDAYFPAEVTDYLQAPGQYATNPTYQIAGNTGVLLGAPVGAGSAQADNTSIVSPGIAGGFVVVKFDPPIEDHPDNIGGYDFIVFGNSIWPGGDPASAWQEPGTIWVMRDENGNGDPDDTWYLIPGSHLSDADTAETKSYIDTDYDTDWWPAGEASPMNLPSAGYPDIFNLPDSLYSTGGTDVLTWGYADVTPTMILGDLTGADGSEGDNSVEDEEDYPGINPVFFYTTPDTHGDRKIDPGSGGGDAVDIAWAVDPAAISAGGVGLDEVTWIMIVSATEKTGTVGEFSCEIDGFARVRRNN